MTQTDSADAINQGASNLVVWFARHWLAIFNTMWGIYFFLPFLAPILMAAGLTAPARLIYSVYSIFCHQLPDHSYFLHSHTHEFAPSAASLAAGGMPTGLSLFQERRFIGNSEVGYKVAICQRDVAIYGSIFLSGLIYALLRGRDVRISWKAAALLTVPMAIDGITQMLGFRESSWWLRSATGALFGFGAVLFLYPFIQRGMDDVIYTETNRGQKTAGPKPAEEASG